MVEYWSEDHDVVDWEAELRKVLGDKLVGLTVRTPNEVIEIRTTVEIEPSEMSEIGKLTGKKWVRKK